MNKAMIPGGRSYIYRDIYFFGLGFGDRNKRRKIGLNKIPRWVMFPQPWMWIARGGGVRRPGRRRPQQEGPVRPRKLLWTRCLEESEVWRGKGRVEEWEGKEGEGNGKGEVLWPRDLHWHLDMSGEQLTRTLAVRHNHDWYQSDAKVRWRFGRPSVIFFCLYQRWGLCDTK